MPYLKRNGGPRGYRHDPADQGIFIHGGTCQMHGRNDNFRHNARPNNFTLTFPLCDDGLKYFSSDFPPQPTFASALELAKRIRAEDHRFHHCPIYACTDFIQEKSYCGRSQIQLASPRLTRAKVATEPRLKAA
jgi:hypothetical protein